MQRASFPRVCLACILAIGLVAAAAFAGESKGKKKGKPQGTIWSYTAKKGSDKESGQFRVYDYEVFTGEKKVGSVKPKDEDETTLLITDYTPLNGKAVLRKVSRKPPLWKGQLVRTDGSVWHLEVTMK